MKRHNILIADDDKAVAQSLRGILATKYNVAVAYTPDEAIQMLAVSQEKANLADRFAVAIIDLSFEIRSGPPGVEGFQILKAAVKDRFIEPVVFTATGDENKASEAQRLGAFRYVKKSEVIGGKRATQVLYTAVADAVDMREKLVCLSRDIETLRHGPTSSDQASLLHNAQMVLRSIMTARGRSHDDSK